LEAHHGGGAEKGPKENQNKNNTKETKYRETKEKHKTKSITINQRRVGRDLAEAPLRKVVIGE
jgi:hypothetical protein